MFGYAKVKEQYYRSIEMTLQNPFNIQATVFLMLTPAPVLGYFHHLLVAAGAQVGHARGIIGHAAVAQLHILRITSVH